MIPKELHRVSDSGFITLVNNKTKSTADMK